MELDNTCEGLARFDNLPKDNYEFVENRYLLRGSKHNYTLGQIVKIEVLASDVDNRKVSFRILDEDEEFSAPKDTANDKQEILRKQNKAICKKGKKEVAK